MRLASRVASRCSAVVCVAALFCAACHDSTAPQRGVKLAFLVQPATVVSAATFSSTVAVVVLDAEGDTVSNADNAITVSLGANPANGTLSGTTTVDAISGFARFFDLKLNKASAGYTLVATSPNLASATSVQFTVSPAKAVSSQFLIQPVGAIAGIPIPPFSVAMYDASGNLATTTPARVDLAGPAGISGTLTKLTSDGVATFTDVTFNVPGSGLLLTARATPTAPNSAQLPAVNSARFDMTTGPATRISFTVQPILTPPGKAIPTVVAAITDIGGNIISSSTTTISLSLGNNPGSSTLGGTTSRQTVNGVASFSDLTVSNPGSRYTLVAVAPNLTGVVSHAFTVRDPLVFESVSAGYFHSCGVAVGGTVNCWGANYDGQLGDSILSEVRGTAEPVIGGLNFISVGAGRTHNCGIVSPHSAWCWGLNIEGQLGVTGFASSFVPLGISETLSFSTAVGGYSHSCALTTAGAAYCWGDNSTGALGIGGGSIGVSGTPVAVTGGISFSTISPGRLFTCGVSTSGAAYCWGDNAVGELGDGTANRRTAPVPVATQLKFAYVGAGGFSSCGLTTNGAAYCWGSNQSGAVGDGTLFTRMTPVAVSGGNTFTMLSVGNRHVCGVTQNGAAYCWGDNTDGNLGDGTTVSSSVPVLVSGGLTFKSVSAGRFHTCGVTTAGAAYCWGTNSNRQLGDGTTVSRLAPVPVR